ncbi:hypothetical protein HDU76_001425, partial [Blyttiomyces sp. JEL0837]
QDQYQNKQPLPPAPQQQQPPQERQQQNGSANSNWGAHRGSHANSASNNYNHFNNNANNNINFNNNYSNNHNHNFNHNPPRALPPTALAEATIPSSFIDAEDSIDILAPPPPQLPTPPRNRFPIPPPQPPQPPIPVPVSVPRPPPLPNNNNMGNGMGNVYHHDADDDDPGGFAMADREYNDYDEYFDEIDEDEVNAIADMEDEMYLKMKEEVLTQSVDGGAGGGDGDGQVKVKTERFDDGGGRVKVKMEDDGGDNGEDVDMVAASEYGDLERDEVDEEDEVYVKAEEDEHEEGHVKAEDEYDHEDVHVKAEDEDEGVHVKTEEGEEEPGEVTEVDESLTPRKLKYKGKRRDWESMDEDRDDGDVSMSLIPQIGTLRDADGDYDMDDGEGEAGGGSDRYFDAEDEDMDEDMGPTQMELSRRVSRGGIGGRARGRGREESRRDGKSGGGGGSRSAARLSLGSETEVDSMVVDNGDHGEVVSPPPKKSSLSNGRGVASAAGYGAVPEGLLAESDSERESVVGDGEKTSSTRAGGVAARQGGVNRKLTLGSETDVDSTIVDAGSMAVEPSLPVQQRGVGFSDRAQHKRHGSITSRGSKSSLTEVDSLATIIDEPAVVGNDNEVDNQAEPSIPVPPHPSLSNVTGTVMPVPSFDGTLDVLGLVAAAGADDGGDAGMSLGMSTIRREVKDALENMNKGGMGLGTLNEPMPTYDGTLDVLGLVDAAGADDFGGETDIGSIRREVKAENMMEDVVVVDGKGSAKGGTGDNVDDDVIVLDSPETLPIGPEEEGDDEDAELERIRRWGRSEGFLKEHPNGKSLKIQYVLDAVGTPHFDIVYVKVARDLMRGNDDLSGKELQDLIKDRLESLHCVIEIDFSQRRDGKFPRVSGLYKMTPSMARMRYPE